MVEYSRVISRVDFGKNKNSQGEVVRRDGAGIQTGVVEGEGPIWAGNIGPVQLPLHVRTRIRVHFSSEENISGVDWVN